VAYLVATQCQPQEIVNAISLIPSINVNIQSLSRGNIVAGAVIARSRNLPLSIVSERCALRVAVVLIGEGGIRYLMPAS
jgi:hypothetical protein